MLFLNQQHLEMGQHLEPLVTLPRTGFPWRFIKCPPHKDTSVVVLICGVVAFYIRRCKPQVTPGLVFLRSLTLLKSPGHACATQSRFFTFCAAWKEGHNRNRLGFDQNPKSPQHTLKIVVVPGRGMTMPSPRRKLQKHPCSCTSSWGQL